MLLLKAIIFWDFPRGPVVKLRLHASNAAGSIPGWGTKILYAMQHSPKEKKKKKKKPHFPVKSSTMTYVSSSLPSQQHPTSDNNKLLTPNANGLTFLPRNETEGLLSKEIYPYTKSNQGAGE